MSDASQADPFTERVDVTTQHDGAFIGRLEIVPMSRPREDVDALRARGADAPQPDRGAGTHPSRSVTNVRTRKARALPDRFRVPSDRRRLSRQGTRQSPHVTRSGR
jgi:hypothetical protein